MKKKDQEAIAKLYLESDTYSDGHGPDEGYDYQSNLEPRPSDDERSFNFNFNVFKTIVKALKTLNLSDKQISDYIRYNIYGDDHGTPNAVEELVDIWEYKKDINITFDDYIKYQS